MSDLGTGFIAGAQMAGILIETATKVTSASTSMGKILRVVSSSHLTVMLMGLVQCFYSSSGDSNAIVVIVI